MRTTTTALICALVAGCGSGTSDTTGGGYAGAGGEGTLQTTTGAGGVGGHGNTTPRGGAAAGGATATGGAGGCACDCPDGPPSPGQLDAFCLDDAHAGAACCKADGAGVGTCEEHTCAASQ